MKKIIASAVGLMLVGGVAATSAFAVESQFGGYWRTRAYFDDNFKQIAPGNDSADNAIDTRTRLYYTAKFSDDLKFVNKFEFNNAWGDNNGGDIAADGTSIWRIKNSYVDFNLGKVNTKVGIQGANISRGFIFADDFSGVVMTADFGMVKVPVLYSLASNKDTSGDIVGFMTNNPATVASVGGGSGDVHILSVMPQIKVTDSVMITPHATWATVTSSDTDVYWLGLDADLKMDAVSAWGTFIYNGGKIDKIALGSTKNQDISAYLVAAGADAGIVHGQAFYASGDDNSTDNNIDSFVTIGSGNGTYGTSYYWSEIMGDGIFDNAVPGNSVGDHLTNIWAANVGVTVKPMDKLTTSFDVWYAQLAKDNAAGDNELGLEFDGKLSYELVDNLSADVVFAYLVAGDAMGPEDIMEGGLQLSLKF